MLSAILFTIFSLFTPLLILGLTYKSPFLRKIGSIIIAYVIGCVVGLSGLFPKTEELTAAMNIITSASIPLAIPMMLFSTDVRSWSKLAPGFIKSLILGLIACVAATVIAFLCLNDGSDPDRFARYCGMLVGVYTGGTANLASLKIALGVSDADYLFAHTYNMGVNAVLLLFLVSCASKVCGLILPKFDAKKAGEGTGATVESHEDELFLGIFKRENLSSLGLTLLITIVIIAVGAGIALIFPKSAFQAVFILVISALAILASMSPKVRGLKRSYETGTYFILVFSLAVAAQFNLDMFRHLQWQYFLAEVIMAFGALLIHVLLSAIARIDTDTTLTTATALTFSPPFVPVVSSALKNKAVLGPGITVGLIGFAVGNYLGFMVFELLKLLA